MSKSTTFTFISGLLLCLSVVALFLLNIPAFVDNFPFLMWIHVALIALLSYGSWRQRKLRKLSQGGVVVFFKGFPAWLALIAIPVAVLVAPIFSEQNFDLGHTTDGQPVTQKSWNEEHGRYFLNLNHTAPIEISLQEYQNLQRKLFELFARAWVLGSYLCLVLWQYVYRRERAYQNAG